MACPAPPFACNMGNRIRIADAKSIAGLNIGLGFKSMRLTAIDMTYTAIR